MKVIVLFLIYFLLFLLITFFVKKKEKYKLVIFLIILLSISFNPSLGKEQFLNNEYNIFRIHSGFIAIFACFLVLLNKKMITLGREWLFFVSFIIISLFDVVFRVSDYVSYLTIFHTYLSIFLLYLIFKSLNQININSILYAFNYLAIVNGILSVAQYITGKKLLIGNINESILYTEGLVIAKRAIGVAGTNNAAGTFAALLFGVVLYNVTKRKDLLSIISLILTLLAAILTLTRISYVAIIIEMVIFGILTINKNKKKIYEKVIFISFISPIVLVFLFYIRMIIYQKLFAERGNTTSSRFDQYERIFDNLFPDNLIFGIGSGQYKSYMLTQFNFRDIDIHSQYLNILVESGIIFFILFVILNFTLSIKIIKSNCDKHLKILTILIFVSNLLCANFNPNQYYYLNNIVYFMILFSIYFKSKLDQGKN